MIKPIFAPFVFSAWPATPVPVVPKKKYKKISQADKLSILAAIDRDFSRRGR